MEYLNAIHTRSEFVKAGQGIEFASRRKASLRKYHDRFLSVNPNTISFEEPICWDDVIDTDDLYYFMNHIESIPDVTGHSSKELRIVKNKFCYNVFIAYLIGKTGSYSGCGWNSLIKDLENNIFITNHNYQWERKLVSVNGQTTLGNTKWQEMRIPLADTLHIVTEIIPISYKYCGLSNVSTVINYDMDISDIEDGPVYK
jgi:hypothetical protein